MEETIEVLDQFDFLASEYRENIEKKCAPLIGRFLIAFSALEFEVNTLIAEAINQRSHEPGYIVVEKLSMANKIVLFYKLYLPIAAHYKKLRLLKELKNKSQEINNFRNLVVHASWISGSKEGFVRSKIVIGEEGSVNFKRIKLTPKILWNNYRKLNSLVKKFEYFDQELEG